jgi:outer membrane immunogenic protein
MMVRAGLAVMATLLGGTALAADLPPRMAAPSYSPVIAVPDVLPWEGFYTGTGIGYMWTTAKVADPFGTANYDLDGTTGVSFIGRNWQFGSFVTSLEAEIGIHETKGTLGVGPTTGAQGDQLWSAGVKGRLGYAFGSVMPYVSAGVATTQFHQHSAVLFDDGDVRRHGGFTLGAGVEIAWTQRFLTRFEYEYASYGRANYNHDGVRHRVDLDTHAVKAALVFKEIPGRLGGGMLSPGRSGSYLGVIAGYAMGDADFTRATGGRTGVDFDGNQIGLFGGYDLSFGSWFVGYDSQTLISPLSGAGGGAGGPIDFDVFWSSDTRLRLGTSFGAISPYIAGGIALAQTQTVSLDTNRRDIEMLYGGTFGAGIDYAFNDRWFGRAEYAYTRYRDAHPQNDGMRNNLEVDRHDIRVGLGYRISD